MGFGRPKFLRGGMEQGAETAGVKACERGREREGGREGGNGGRRGREAGMGSRGADKSAAHVTTLDACTALGGRAGRRGHDSGRADMGPAAAARPSRIASQSSRTLEIVCAARLRRGQLQVVDAAVKSGGQQEKRPRPKGWEIAQGYICDRGPLPSRRRGSCMECAVCSVAPCLGVEQRIL
jgi:hypothetical protein